MGSFSTSDVNIDDTNVHTMLLFHSCFRIFEADISEEYRVQLFGIQLLPRSGIMCNEMRSGAFCSGPERDATSGSRTITADEASRDTCKLISLICSNLKQVGGLSSHGGSLLGQQRCFYSIGGYTTYPCNLKRCLDLPHNLILLTKEDTYRQIFLQKSQYETPNCIQ